MGTVIVDGGGGTPESSEVRKQLLNYQHCEF